MNELSYSASAAQQNGCLNCSMGQHCCSQLDGLLLSPEEYRRHFERFSDRLEVRRTNKCFTVFAHGACPHWEGRCTIYADRPMDCRLFPASIWPILKWGRLVTITIHSRPMCPLKSELSPSDTNARLLVSRWARQVWRDDWVWVNFDRGAWHLFLIVRRALRRWVNSFEKLRDGSSRKTL